MHLTESAEHQFPLSKTNAWGGTFHAGVWNLPKIKKFNKDLCFHESPNILGKIIDFW